MSGLRRSVLVALLAVLVSASLDAVTPNGAVARPGVDPIYRLRIRVATTSSSESLSLGGPAWFVTGRKSVQTNRTGVSAFFGGFGPGPVRVSQPRRETGPWARATFV